MEGKRSLSISGSQSHPLSTSETTRSSVTSDVSSSKMVTNPLIITIQSDSNPSLERIVPPSPTTTTSHSECTSTVRAATEHVASSSVACHSSRTSRARVEFSSPLTCTENVGTGSRSPSPSVTSPSTSPSPTSSLSNAGSESRSSSRTYIRKSSGGPHFELTAGGHASPGAGSTSSTTSTLVHASSVDNNDTMGGQRRCSTSGRKLVPILLCVPSAGGSASTSSGPTCSSSQANAVMSGSTRRRHSWMCG